MNKLWSDLGWEQYLNWQEKDKKIIKKINGLIKDIERNGPMSGIGKPEKLKYREGYSRRIDEKNRLTYDVTNSNILMIITCKGHYED